MRDTRNGFSLVELAPRSSSKQENDGFSLVELAVVLMIVGLLIAGVLKGREIYDNSRVNALGLQITKIETATRAFKSSYGDLPGDLRTATTRLPGCSGVCGNGDGNGQIGANAPNEATMTSATAENRYYWLHLAKTGLYNGIDPDYAGTPNQWGVDFPRNPFSGGIVIRYLNGVGAAPYPFWANVHTLRVQASPTSWSGPQAMPVALLAQFDRKFDDGQPAAGKILSARAVAPDCFTTVSGQAVYPNNKALFCDINIKANF